MSHAQVHKDWYVPALGLIHGTQDVIAVVPIGVEDPGILQQAEVGRRIQSSRKIPGVRSQK